MTTEPVSPPLVAFVGAIDAGDDEATEALVPALAPSDERQLLALAVSGAGDRRWWALRALAQMGSDAAVPAFVAALADADAALRALAALGMGHLFARTPAAVAAHLHDLAARLADDDGFVRQAAVDGLALCGAAALPVLESVLVTSENEGARTRAAAALRAMRSIKAAPLLFRFLNDPNHLVHTFAHEALDDLGLLDNLLLMP